LEDIELDHGTIHIHRSRNREDVHDKGTKTKAARRFTMEPAIVPLVRAMHEESNGEGHVIQLPNDKHLARDFRQWLSAADVDRAELHASTPTRKAMTFHDLRATGLTWLAIRGDDPLKIMQRAGHADFSTTQGYIRTAEAVRDGFGRVFPPLPSHPMDQTIGPTVMQMRGMIVEAPGIEF
jgi:integrase